MSYINVLNIYRITPSVNEVYTFFLLDYFFFQAPMNFFQSTCQLFEKCIDGLINVIIFGYPTPWKYSLKRETSLKCLIFTL